jgi:hypothetical protein
MGLKSRDAAFGERGLKLFERVAFAPRGLGKALIEVGLDSSSVPQQPILLRFYEVKRVCQELRRLGKRPAGQLLLDALLGYGIEGDGHIESITLAGRQRNGRG